MDISSADAGGARAGHQSDALPRAAWIELALLCAAQLMLVLDMTVVNVALPEIGRMFGPPLDMVGWVIIAYGIPFGGLLLLGGRTADVLGARRVLIAGLLLFTGASLLAGLSTSMPVLLAARCLQGIGAALLSPSALASVTERFPEHERHRALAIWAAVGAVGAAVGVLVGGLLTAGFGWRTIFFVNVPVGILVLALLRLLAPAPETRRTAEPIGLRGAVLVTGTIATLLYGLTTVNNASSIPSWLTFAATAVLLLSAIASERHADRRLVDWALLRRRTISGGGLVMLSATGLMVGGFFLLSFTVQQSLNWSALTTGVGFLPIALATLVGAHFGGHVAAHAGSRRLAVTAFLVSAAGMGLAALSQHPAALIGGVAISAFGLGGGFVAASITALSGSSGERAGAKSGLLNTCHELGGGLGVALLSATFSPGAALTAAVASEGFGSLCIVALAAAALAFLAMPSVTPGPDTPRFVH